MPRKPAKEKAKQDEGKLTVGEPKPGKPVFVFTESSWLINLDQISCARLKGDKGKLEEVDIWFIGQNWPKPALTLKGKDADHFVGTLWRRSRVKRHFVKEEMTSDD